MRLTPLLALPALLLMPATARALPVPPCAGAAYPPPAAVGAPPAVEAWLAGELPAGWRPPACLGWPGDGSYVAAAGRFAVPGGVDTLAARVGGIAAMGGLRYWSVSREAWQPLYDRSTAVTGPDGATPRGDFAADELGAGAAVHILQDPGDRVGPMVQRLTVLERDADALEIEIVNVTAGEALLLEVIPAGGLRSRVRLDREDGDVWRYYALTRVDDILPGPLRPPRASWINRAVALYRWVAGIPSDQEPPAAPR
jgi:hypothetical protein